MTQLESKEAYKAYYEGLGQERMHQVVKYNPHRMRFCRPVAGQTVLELGCGTGGNLIVMARRGCLATGVELSHGMIEAGQKFIHKWFGPLQRCITFHHGWIEDFDSPERYDYVLLTEVLEHVQDPVPILKVAKKYLKPGGEVYITAPAIRVGGDSHVRGVSFEDLQGWLQEAGLHSVWSVEQPNRLKGAIYPTLICRAVAL